MILLATNDYMKMIVRDLQRLSSETESAADHRDRVFEEYTRQKGFHELIEKAYLDKAELFYQLTGEQWEDIRWNLPDDWLEE